MSKIKSGKFFQITVVGEVPIEMTSGGATDEQIGAMLSSGLSMSLTLAALVIGSQAVILDQNPFAGQGGN